ncbi:MAG: hypothetical protein WCE81_07505 [Halobacteriota archaeon]
MQIEKQNAIVQFRRQTDPLDRAAIAYLDHKGGARRRSLPKVYSGRWQNKHKNACCSPSGVIKKFLQTTFTAPFLM